MFGEAYNAHNFCWVNSTINCSLKKILGCSTFTLQIYGNSHQWPSLLTNFDAFLCNKGEGIKFNIWFCIQGQPSLLGEPGTCYRPPLFFCKQQVWRTSLMMSELSVAGIGILTSATPTGAALWTSFPGLFTQPRTQASSRYPSYQRRLGTEGDSILGEFSRQVWQVTSHPKSPRTTGNEDAFSLIKWEGLKGKSAGNEVAALCKPTGSSSFNWFLIYRGKIKMKW